MLIGGQFSDADVQGPPPVKLVKVGAKIVRHGRYFTFQLAEFAVPGNLFREILRLIDGLRPRPPTRCCTGAWNHVG